MSDCNYDRLPEHMQEAARNYIENGIKPGSFLTAVLENNLVKAYCYADGINLLAMHDWATWLYNDVPGNAWGSRNKVEAWLTGFRERAQGPAL